MPAEGTGRAIDTRSTAPDGPAVIVFAGGEPVDPALVEHLPADALVIAADSGLYQARRLGYRVDVAVGDFDSITDADLRDLGADAEVDRHPTAKDRTDIEIGLDTAHERGATQVDVVAGAGGRLDHALANVLLLALPVYAQMDVRGWIGGARLDVVRGTRRVSGEVGATVSLLAVGGPATGVTTTGLRYGLTDGTLHAGSTRGVSNVFDESIAEVTVADGCVLAVQPAPEERTETA